MGFYLKKGINFGPLRLNVSKSGLGMSFGAKGLRLGYGTKRFVYSCRSSGFVLQKKFKPEIMVDIDWLRDCRLCNISGRR